MTEYIYSLWLILFTKYVVDTTKYNIIKNISLTSGENNAGTISITNCSNGNEIIFNLDNLVADTISDTIILNHGIRYKVSIKRTNGSNSEIMIFNNILFESSNSDITYTEVDHITGTKY